MKVLLHACCGPCTIYPFTLLQQEGLDVTAFFYNPNIHPFQEFKRRLNSLKQYASSANLPLITENAYGLRDFVREIAFHEEERCQICYRLRLQKTAAFAKDHGYDAFSTTLLYSKYQRHQVLIKMCQDLASTFSIAFLYRDFREGWQFGVDKSIELSMYRQPYCGCIYSEQERYDKSLRKKFNLDYKNNTLLC